MKTLIHLLEGDIKQIRDNYKLTDKDDKQVSEMQQQLIGDKNLCKKLGWRNYKLDSKVLKTKAYLLALENYVTIRYGDDSTKRTEDDEDTAPVI